MRLLLTTDTVGGVWTYALELARALDSHGVRIALAAMGAPLSASQRREVDSVSNIQLFPSEHRLEWMSDPWDDVGKAGRWLLDIEQQFQPDMVHLNGYVHGALAWRAPTLVAAHSCVLSWWQAVKGCAAPDSWDRYHREVAKGLHSVDAVVAPSEAMLEAVAKHYGRPRNARVIYNGRSPHPFGGLAHHKEPFILSAGRLWDEAKNIAALESIAPDLDWPVYVAGESAHPNGRNIRSGNVRMLGKLSTDQLAPWLRNASIYAMPARYEPFGLSILEAALGGCALVLGDIPSLRELWDDAALFVPPDDHDALARTLQTLTRDSARIVELGRRARVRASSYNPERMAHSYMTLYRELCGWSAPSSGVATSVTMHGIL